MNLPQRKQQLWFFIDELASLNRLDSLILGLREFRKYGGCFVISTQNVSQLDEIYGVHDAESLLELLNTKIIFKCGSDKGAQKMARELGLERYSRINENLSIGANDMRDGVSLNTLEKENPVIFPEQIKSLPDFHAFVSFPGDYPITKIICPLVKDKDICPPSIPRDLGFQLDWGKKAPSKNLTVEHQEEENSSAPEALFLDEPNKNTNIVDFKKYIDN